MLYTANDIQPQLDELYEKGHTKGYDIGFKGISELYTMKPGCTTYIVGHEASGKSELILEILLNMAEFHGKRSAVFTPETGSNVDIVAALAHKYVKRPFCKDQPKHMDEAAKYQAYAFLSEYFVIIDPGTDTLTADQFYDLIDDHEQKTGQRIDITCIDPWNELTVKMDGPRDLWLEEKLGMVRRNARKTGRHNIIVTHPRDTDRLYHKDGYWMAPARKDYAGGQAWPRKGEAMICLWRAPFKPASDGINTHIDPETGTPYEKNEAHFIVQKSKPKGTGSVGVCRLYFDPGMSRYYERDGQTRYYAAKDKHQELAKENNNDIYNIRSLGEFAGGREYETEDLEF